MQISLTRQTSKPLIVVQKFNLLLFPCRDILQYVLIYITFYMSSQNYRYVTLLLLMKYIFKIPLNHFISYICLICLKCWQILDIVSKLFDMQNIWFNNYSDANKISLSWHLMENLLCTILFSCPLDGKVS